MRKLRVGDIVTIDEVMQRHKENVIKSVREIQKTGSYRDIPYIGGNFFYPTSFDVLVALWDEIPDSQKYDITIAVYIMTKSPSRYMKRYLQAIKPLKPESLPEQLREYTDKDGFITVYHGGIHENRPACCPSWTLSESVANFFAEKNRIYGNTYIYKGRIKPGNVIAYTDEREEKEIIQYRSVTNIDILRSYCALERG